MTISCVATDFLERYYCIGDFGMDWAKLVIYHCGSYIKTGEKKSCILHSKYTYFSSPTC